MGLTPAAILFDITGSAIATGTGTLPSGSNAVAVRIPDGDFVQITGTVHVDNLPVTQSVHSVDNAGTGAVTTAVFTSASNNALLGSTPSRLGFTVFNDSTGIYLVKLGASVSDTSFSFVLQPGTMFDSGQMVYTGAVNGRGWGAGSGTIYVTELTP